MKPIDFRNATWKDLQDRLHGSRRRALHAWRIFGPGTTREVAKRSGIDILTLRPRTTELVQLGLVVVDDSSKEHAHEGIYRGLEDREALEAFQKRCAVERGTQSEFSFSRGQV